MGWTLTGLGVALVIVVVAGAALALCRRYCIGWQWGTRSIWNVCEEWRQRLSWLWAPREEKVGLVKAQHPTAQTIPGLCRQPGNTSQHLLHSDSDLRLDAQGAFTRFEPVDRDLHPPLGTTASGTIPPQPLRPAPQPRPTPRPRPTPLQPSSAVDYLRMQEAGPGPLTPPPSLQRAQVPSRSTGPSVFLFQSEPVKSYGLHKATSNEHTAFRFDDDATRKSSSESIQMTPYGTQNHMDTRLRYELDEERRKLENRCNPYNRQQFDNGAESTRIRYGVHGAPIATLDGKGDEEEVNASYGSYDIVQRGHMIRQQQQQHARNDSRSSPSSFGMTNSTNAASQTIVESMYRPDALSKMLQNASSLGDELDRKGDQMQGIEMTPFRSLQDEIDSSSYVYRETQGLQRVSQYIQSLPDLPVYESMNELTLRQDQDRMLYDATIQESIKVSSESASSPVPPPPAPPDPPKDTSKKNGPTTGERIFNALRLVTSQSYIDASEFYNSVLSSAQQVQRFTFSSRSPTLVEDSVSSQLRDDVHDIYGENDSDAIGPDGSKRSSDLYSPELNLEAHRTAQEVYNSLQDPPSSPLLLKGHNNPEMYTYITDPSFTRTSEDILNSIEQRRKSMERLNGIHELNELDDADSLRKRNSQEFYAALEEVQLKRKLSQSLEDAFITSYTLNDHNELSPGSRRGPQAPEPEPPPDESNLKRAISCESVCSDTSVVLNDLDETPVVGHVCIGIEYDRWGGRGGDNEGDLAVSVLEARDLVTPDGQPARDTFARVCLLPDKQMHVKCTRLYRGNPSPSYQEKFPFHLDGGLTGRTLLVEVFSDESSRGGGASLIGEASLRLGPAPRAATTWLPLAGSVLPTPRLGELMFSLSYLPTAERLTLVVVKARNLRGTTSIPGDFFVKVYLLQQGKKIHKKKTSVKRGEKSPIFNEAIIFNVPTHILQDIQIRLTVAEVTGEQGTNSKPYSVGHVIVGPTSTVRASDHWRQMLAALRRPVAMWHPLRK